jgi:hypothetical protein
MRRSTSAETLRNAERERVAALSPAERVALALELGEQDLGLLAANGGQGREEARRALERRRQARRRRSGCLDALLA